MDNSYIILKLDPEQAKLHEVIYADHIKKLIAEIDHLSGNLTEKKNELRAYESLLESISGGRVSAKLVVGENGKNGLNKPSNGNNIPAYGIYIRESSLAKKCEYILKESRHLLSVRQLAEEILKIESDFLKIKETTFDKFQKNLGATLVQKISRNDTFFRESIGNEYKYGLIKQKTDYVK